MEEKNTQTEIRQEVRADVPQSTTYQLVEIRTVSGKMAWQFTLTTPTQAIIEDISLVLLKHLSK